MITWSDMQHLLALLNFGACTSIGWFCVCRLNTDKARIYRMARLRYTLMMAAATSSGLQPLLWGEWPSVADTALALAVCAWLAMSTWGAPHPYDGPRRRMGDLQ